MGGTPDALLSALGEAPWGLSFSPGRSSSESKLISSLALAPIIDVQDKCIVRRVKNKYFQLFHTSKNFIFYIKKKLFDMCTSVYHNYICLKVTVQFEWCFRLMEHICYFLTYPYKPIYH